MKIITVNLPVKFLQIIEGLVGEKGLYPSRSELIRVAVRDFLIKELDSAQSFAKLQNNINNTAAISNLPEIDENMFVRVPVEMADNSVEYKTYRIIKK